MHFNTRYLATVLFYFVYFSDILVDGRISSENTSELRKHRENGKDGYLNLLHRASNTRSRIAEEELTKGNRVIHDFVKEADASRLLKREIQSVDRRSYRETVDDLRSANRKFERRDDRIDRWDVGDLERTRRVNILDTRYVAPYLLKKGLSKLVLRFD